MKRYRVVFTDGDKEITKDLKAKNLNHLYHQMDVMGNDHGLDVISYSRLYKVSGKIYTDLMKREVK